jgi:hypothetical protein
VFWLSLPTNSTWQIHAAFTATITALPVTAGHDRVLGNPRLGAAIA